MSICVWRHGLIKGGACGGWVHFVLINKCIFYGQSALESEWPVKSRQMSLKVAQKWFH